jgi:hypothetical protein
LHLTPRCCLQAFGLCLESQLRFQYSPSSSLSLSHIALARCSWKCLDKSSIPCCCATAKTLQMYVFHCHLAQSCRLFASFLCVVDGMRSSLHSLHCLLTPSAARRKIRPPVSQVLNGQLRIEQSRPERVTFYEPSQFLQFQATAHIK